MRRVFFTLLALIILSGCSTEVSSGGDSGQLDAESESYGGLCKPNKESVGIKAIYGQDDRAEWYDSEKALVSVAQSTVALVKNYQLGDLLSGFRLSGVPLGDARNLCARERFGAQPTAAFCSGFLVGPDLVMTAGHCIQTQSDCSSVNFIFDYAYDERNSISTDMWVDKNDTYSCAKVLKTVLNNDTDYALIQLDRKVSGRKPLPIRRSGKASSGDQLVLIGHPSGLPSKIAPNGKVQGYLDNGQMIADVDAFGGNSGSVIFNKDQGVVEGILVAGDQDYEVQSNCTVAYRCEGQCSGEIITPASHFKSSVPQLTQTSSYLNICKSE